jgi:hypothetical protein
MIRSGHKTTSARLSGNDRTVERPAGMWPREGDAGLEVARGRPPSLTLPPARKVKLYNGYKRALCQAATVSGSLTEPFAMGRRRVPAG